MAFIFLQMLKQAYERCQIWRRLNRLEKYKLNAIRKKYKLKQLYTLSDCICDIICFPFCFVLQILFDLLERMVTSLGSRKRKFKRDGHMKRVFKDLTVENILFRKVIYFLFGITLTYLTFIFIYYQHFLNNYSLIFALILTTIVLAMISPFNEQLLYLILIALPSLFSSNVRYIFVAFVYFTLYTQVFPNIWNNGILGVQSFACSVLQTAKGSKQVSALLVQDIRDYINSTKQKMREIAENMKGFAKHFDMNIKTPNLNLKAMCNGPTDQLVYKCEDSITMGHLKDKRMYPPFICTTLWKGFANFCNETKRSMEEMYKKARNGVLETVEKVERELYFDAELNHDFGYVYNSSKNMLDVFKKIGTGFLERHYFLTYFEYLLHIRVIILFVVTFWIIFASILYRFRYLNSDPFDNVYINEELKKIDRKRAENNRETIFPLDINEKKIFISTFDPMMTTLELTRFLVGITLMSTTLGQVILLFVLDFGIYYAVKWYNTFIDVLIDLFTPASIKFEFEGNSFFAKRLNKLNEGFDIKKKIVERLQECKEIPTEPVADVYNKILLYLVLILITVFMSSYGIRFRQYISGLFYPHRIAIRAVWLYNTILSRRGNLFQFWRKQMRKKVFGDNTSESVSIVDRLCAQFAIIRMICTLIGIYGKHKYCQICGVKVMIDGSDQSVSCSNKCSAYYCFECIGEQANTCAVCMNPIDLTQLGDISEELDSSDEETVYNLQNEDFLYQFTSESSQLKSYEEVDDWEDYDMSVHQRRDLVSLAYRYDTIDSVPSVVYLVDDEGYDAEDESEDIRDYQRYLFDLEQELGIPAEQILEMKRNAKQLVAEDIEQSFVDKVNIEKYSQLKREDDQKLVRNALLLVNKDKKKNIRKVQN